jgi:hypothetical protein
LTLSFGPKVVFGTLFNPFVFFSCPVLAKLGVLVPSFNDFADISNVVKQMTSWTLMIGK